MKEVFGVEKRPRSPRARRWMNAGAVLFLLALGLLCLRGWQLGLFKSLETLQAYIERTGVWAPLAFLLLQVLQILMAFIPGGMLHTGGVVIFGPWEGLLYNFAGTLLGSALNFWLARRWGRAIARHLLPEATCDKYLGWLNQGKRFDRLFAWSILLPFFPDDALCLIAGLSDMSWRRFALLLLLKLPSIAVYSLAYALFGYLL